MRLIDADALKEDFKERNIWNPEIVSAIDNAPAVIINTNDIEYKAYCRGLDDDRKIARRPKGEWVKDHTHEEHGNTSIVCSICSHSVPNKSNFCPNCGAENCKGAE